MSCPDKLALMLAVLCEKDSMDLLWPIGGYWQIFITRNWLVTSSYLFRNLTWNLALSTQCRDHNWSGPWMCCCLLLPVSSTCQLRLVCSWTKGRKDFSSVGLSAEFCNLLEVSATFNLGKNWLSGMWKQNHLMNFGLYPLLPSLVTARVIIWKPPYSRTKTTCYLNMDRQLINK